MNGCIKRETKKKGMPDGWRFSALCQNYDFTKKPRSLIISQYESIPFVPMELIPVGKLAFNNYISKKPSDISSGTYFENGDLLLAKITPSFENGKQGIISNLPKGFGYATTEVIPIKGRDSVSDIEFLAYYLLDGSVRSSLSGKMEGTTGRQRLSHNVLENLRIPSPPYPEQKKIAAILSKIRQAIEVQERIIERTNELKRALMAKLFTEGLYGEELKETAIGLIPTSWKLKSCAEICHLITVGVVVRPASYYVENGVPAFRSLNIREDRLDTRFLVFFSQRDNDLKLVKSRLRFGDVLVVRTGYPGTACVVPMEYEGANCIDLVITRPNNDIVLSSYLSRFLNSPVGKRQALTAKYGLAQQHLNVGAVKRTIVPIPSIEEQAQINTTFTAIDRQIELCSKRKKVLEGLFGSVLSQLMTGQTRVNNIEISFDA